MLKDTSSAKKWEEEEEEVKRATSRHASPAQRHYPIRVGMTLKDINKAEDEEQELTHSRKAGQGAQRFGWLALGTT